MSALEIERSGFESQTVDIQQGEEVGIKSATLLVSGEYVYGHLQAQRGVHRLVGISPFNTTAHVIRKHGCRSSKSPTLLL